MVLGVEAMEWGMLTSVSDKESYVLLRTLLSFVSTYVIGSSCCSMMAARGSLAAVESTLPSVTEFMAAMGFPFWQCLVLSMLDGVSILYVNRSGNPAGQSVEWCATKNFQHLKQPSFSLSSCFSVPVSFRTYAFLVDSAIAELLLLMLNQQDSSAKEVFLQLFSQLAFIMVCNSLHLIIRPSSRCLTSCNHLVKSVMRAVLVS